MTNSPRHSRRAASSASSAALPRITSSCSLVASRITATCASGPTTSASSGSVRAIRCGDSKKKTVFPSLRIDSKNFRRRPDFTGGNARKVNLSTGSADAGKAEYLTEILEQIQLRGLTGSVTRIDMTDVTNPRFDYLGRFTVELGPQGDTEYQFGKLLSAVAQLTENDRGTIDLSLEGARAVFSP